MSTTTDSRPDVVDVYDVTPLQHGLLFHCLRAPDGGHYIEQLHFTVRGELRTDLLREAWQTIVERHAGLRTSFSWDDINRPVQVVHRTAELPLDQWDLSGVPAAQREAEFAERLLEERRVGFDLERAPLLRLSVVRWDGDVHRLVWRFSHLVLDGWSFGLLMADFVALYKALYHRRAPVLARPVPPRDYVAWWRRQDGSGLRTHWRENLAGYRPPPQLNLGERPGPVDDPVTHDFAELRLGALAVQLRTVSRERGLTLNTLVQGAWTLVLGRSHGVDDVVVGATMSHRPADLVGCEQIVGPLIVTLPIRVRIEDSRSAAAWLAEVQAAVVDAREHAALPLPEIRRCAEVPLSTDLFETIVSFENVPIPQISFADEGLEHLGHDVDGRPQYPMSLVVLPGPDMPLRLVYDRRRFGTASATRMLDRLAATLRSFTTDLDRPIARTDVLPEQEREQILALAGPRHRGDVRGCLPDLVRRQAERKPDGIAVTASDATLSYRELVARAEVLARRLRAAGVRRHDRVAVGGERSAALVVGSLAVLLAGATTVPLDPAHPRDRLLALLADCRPRAVLADRRFVEVVGPLTGPTILPLDAEPASGAPSDEPDGDADLPQRDPGDVAYVVHTSGSTGRPKGVVVTDHNVVRLVEGAHEELGLRDDDVWSAFFAPAFDGAQWEMWGALGTGGRLVVVPPSTSREPDELLALLIREQVTICTQTPSAFEQLIAAAAGTARTALRTVVLGGEKVEPATLHGWFAEQGTGTRVINAYGPTETTVWVCHHEIVPAETEVARGPSLIGRPLPDTGIYLLDPRRQLVALGAPGEMHVAGPGVAQGYLDRPDLTEERFGSDPFGSGGRMYATGDLARMGDDGELEYLGRLDDQVKVRGHRVEFGEVECRLREHPAVRAAVADLRPGNAGPRLLAWVVPGPGGCDPSDLRPFCAEALPEYMVPSAVMVVETIPLTSHGKVDRAALPEGVAPVRDSTSAPRTATERRMAELLAELLDVPEVGVDDNLVDLGLHSLLATRVVAGIRGIWRVGVPLRSLFETPTVTALAAIVDTGGTGSGLADRPGRVRLEDEARLAPDLAPTGGWTWVDDPQHILLTGVTGFPGAFLAAELARSTEATLHCLIRADDEDAGRERMREHLRGLGLWTDDLEHRLRPVPGDLSQPLLGLTPDVFHDLGDRVERIYHLGAHVNFVHPYRRLRSVNVGGTLEVLRLAATGRPSVLHHVSGVGVLPPPDPRGGAPLAWPEDELDAVAHRLANGYSETKWVAERLVAQAGLRGLPVVIHRLGRVTGHSSTGAWRAAGDALGELVRAAVALGRLPEFEGRLDMVPVDFVARALVEAGRRPEAVGTVLHLVNPDPPTFADVQSGFRAAGHPSGSSSLQEWYAALLELAARSDQDWSVPVALLGEWVQHERAGLRQPVFDCARTSAFLGSEVRCPRVDDVVLTRSLQYLAAEGFVPHGASGEELACVPQPTSGS